ncbi:MAG TPA: hypothetical protein PLE97_09305, partial [Tenuifilaceae bacterium]|nr:hypothetical protein [Tenuifilaceae bacterium]
IDFQWLYYNKGKPMTVQEALDYVYNGDTSRLHCIYEIFNMETEKVIGTARELFLPKKYFLVELDSCYLVANSSFLCENEYGLMEVSLILHVIGKDLELKSSLEVYRGNEYDDYLMGMINTANGRIFLTSFEKKSGSDAKLLKMNQESLRYEVIKEKKPVEMHSDNWKRELEKLGWYEDFLGQ